MQKPSAPDATYWQQCDLLTIEDAALFLSRIEDPISHRELIESNDMAYDHYMATKYDEVCLNVALVRDVIESKRITVTPESAARVDHRNWDIKIFKSDFVDWCKSNGRFDVVRLLVPAFVIDNVTLSKDDMTERDAEIVQRHKQYKSQGMKNPTKQVAVEFGISPPRVRQILQKNRSQQPVSLSVTSQLNAAANAKLKR